MLSLLKTLNKLGTSLRSGSRAPQTKGVPASRSVRIESWGRLEILETVGRGAFGTVYRAWDPDLDREVALKVLASGVTADEAKLLARVRHPNVATVYGAGSEGGQLGIWMEFIHGHNLEQLLELQGSFSPREAILVGIDVCRALAAVHSAGLLHRDIKTQNVMRENGGRIVLMDFGLSFPKGEVDKDLGGTPLYLAPEVLKGGEPTVSSDLYALGVMLFHLLSARYPVTGSTWSNLLAAHENGERLLLHDARPDLPFATIQVIERCITPDPDSRFPTTGALAHSLSAVLAANSKVVPLYLQRRAFLAGIAGMAVVGYGAWFLSNRPQSLHVGIGARIIVADLQNDSGDEQIQALTQSLRNLLEQSSYFEVVSIDRISEILHLMGSDEVSRIDGGLARQVALRVRAALVVSGAVSRIDPGYAVTVRVDKMGPGNVVPLSSTLRTFAADNKQELFRAAREASIWVRSAAGESRSEMADLDRRAEDVSTGSWAALAAYYRAERLRTAHKDLEAVRVLEDAIESDPDFALAHMRMGDILINLKRQKDGFAAYQRARHSVDVRPPAKREEFRIKGLFASDTGDFAQAEKMFDGWSSYYPQDALAVFYHAKPLTMLGRVDEAIQKLHQFDKMQADAPYLPTNLGLYLLLTNQTNEARAQAARLRDLGRWEWAAFLEAAAGFLDMNFSGARKSLQDLARSEDPRWRCKGKWLSASLVTEFGRFEDALLLLINADLEDKKAGLTTERVPNLLAQGYSYIRLGMLRDAVVASLQAIEIEQGPQCLSRAGYLLCQAGRRDLAQGLLSGLSGDGPFQQKLAYFRLRGELALSESDSEQAVKNMDQAREFDAPIGGHEYLGRALLRAGNWKAAFDVFSHIADVPGLYWQWPEQEFPGSWRGALEECVQLARQLQLENSAVYEKKLDQLRE